MMMVGEKVLVCWGEPESVTVMVRGYDCPVVLPVPVAGVPLIVFPVSVNPDGSVPEVMAQV